MKNLLVLMVFCCFAITSRAVVTQAPFVSSLPKGNAIAYDILFSRMGIADASVDAAWTGCRTSESLSAMQRDVRSKLLTVIGELPPKCPLDAKTTGRIARNGYTVEKVMFSSEPNHHVTAHLFLPDPAKFSGRRPAVVIPCGHSWDGKLEGSYQRGALQAALRGMIALVYDPLDQGERVQSRGCPNRRCCTAHNALGRRAELLGWSMTRFRLRDGIRALDYLESRLDVDPAKLGVAGHSGGGTMTSWIMALDDRVRAAAPSGFLSSLRAVCREIGPQDAEQMVFGELAIGFNHLGHILLRAPSPVFVCSSHGDFFPITGTIDTVTRAAAVYAVFDGGNSLAFSDTLGSHHWHESTRNYAMDFLAAHFGIGPKPHSLQHYRNIEYVFVEKDSDLGLAGNPSANVTPNGSVMSLPGERSAFDIIRDEAARQVKSRKPLNRDIVRRVAGIRPSAEISSDGTPIVIRTNGEGRPILYVSDGGKDLSRAGCKVFAADIRGFGENGRLVHEYYGVRDADEELSVLHGLLGEHIVGKRAEDIILAAKHVARVCGARPRLVAKGRAAIPAAHAHYVEPDLFDGVELITPPPSWAHFLSNDTVEGRFADIVRGAWAYYDWTNLLPVR